MLTLISGVPGTGKSLFLVDRLAFFSDWRDRQVFIDGIPGINQDVIPHTRLPFEGTLWDFELELDGTRKLNEETGSYIRTTSRFGICTAANWPDWMMPGDLLVVDECQRHYRTRSTGAKVPLSVSELEVHRSRYGVDLVYTTQKPSIIDSNVKAQVGQYFYIREGWFGRYLYEASEVFNHESRTERGLQRRSRYRLPKRSFSFYISAPTHNKKTRKLPFVVFLFPLILIAIGYLMFLSYQSFDKKRHPERYVSAVSSELASASKPPNIAAGSVVVKPLSLASYQPVIPGRPETAPVFDSVRHVSVMPLVSACLRTASKCVCYTQQATRLQDVTQERCNQILDAGRSFNMYSQPVGGQS